MKGDFSRLRRELGKRALGERYSSVRMQQGRVQLDSDWNEQVDVQGYLREQALVDVIGRCGYPKSRPDSFRVSIPQDGDDVPDRTKLTVDGGRMWVQGVLCERDESFSIVAPGEGGRHVVYLEVWQRLLTRVEAPDIVEAALGGPDTTARTQTVCRVALAKLGDDQADARCADVDLEELLVKTGKWTSGSLTPVVEGGGDETPCIVPTTAGYTRLENQLYRVEVHRSGTVGQGSPPTIKWSRENGSILTELKEIGSGETSIHIADKGKDDVLSFTNKGWVELSDDDRDLAGEPGVLVEVRGGPTESDRGGYELQIDKHGQTLPTVDPDKHPKARRWDHVDGTHDGLPINDPDTAIKLEDGITVTFSEGFYRAGDYWVIPARTVSADSVGQLIWPSDGVGGYAAQAPHGVVRRVCKLAIVNVVDGEFGEPEDCTKEFPPLTDLPQNGGVCCGVTVGGNGRGQYETVSEALAQIPNGGMIVILDGTLNERIVLDGVTGVVIRGCGRHTRVAPSGGGSAIAIRNSTNVAIRSLHVQATASGECVEIDGERTSEVVLEDLDLVAGAAGAIVGHRGARVTVRGCRVTTEGVRRNDDRRPGVFLAGTDLRIEGNVIRGAVPSSSGAETAAGGGIQIGGGSTRVRIVRNLIVGGIGDGIALGSVSIKRETFDLERMLDRVRAEESGEVRILANDPEAEKAKKHYHELKREPTRFRITKLAARDSWTRERLSTSILVTLVSDGSLEDIEIRDNEILNTGGSGIATAHFFEALDDDREKVQDGIVVRNLRVLHNRISGCLLVARAAGGAAVTHGEGGIALSHASVLDVRDNLIEGNGPPPVQEQFALPVCGVYLNCGQEVNFEGNRIVGNGLEPHLKRVLMPGRRGGIVIDFVMAPEAIARWQSDERRIEGRRGSARHAVRIHGNVVDTPAGRAVDVLAYGAVSVSDNQLTTRYSSLPALGSLEKFEDMGLEELGDSVGGAVVSILNLGEGTELAWSRIGLRGLEHFARVIEQPPPFATGMTRLQSNRIILQGIDPHARDTDFVPSLVTVAGLDECSLGADQILAEMRGPLNEEEVQVGWSVAVLGSTVRVEGERIQEALTQAAFSAYTYGLLNTTTDNRTTHCIVSVARHSADDFRNLTLQDQLFDGCGRARELEARIKRDYFEED